MKHEKAKIWFFTDFHGSDLCFDKFLNLPTTRVKPNVIIVGGDITGKQIVPLVHDGNGNFHVSIGGANRRLPNDRLKDMSNILSQRGYYPYECDQDHYSSFAPSNDATVKNSEVFNKIFEKLLRERLERWIEKADRKLPSRDECQVFVNAGNDDPLFVDQIIAKSSKLIQPEERIHKLPCDIQMVSSGYANQTPWKCPRDLPEERLKEKIFEKLRLLSPFEPKRIVFNFHCPPFGSTLDIADAVDPATFRKVPSLRGAAKQHVGSTAVREAIDYVKPLVSFHGHIHESRSQEIIGQTVCFNPGTDFRNGNLQGAYVQINKAGEIELKRLTDERNEDRAGVSAVGSTLSAIPFFGKILDSYRNRQRDQALLDKIDHLSADIGKTNQELKDLRERAERK